MLPPRGVYADSISSPSEHEGHQWVWYRPLTRLGYPISVFDRLLRPPKQIREFAKELDAAFVFFMPVNDEFPERVVRELRDDPRPITIAWGSDDNRRWADYSAALAPLFNCYVTTYEEPYRAAREAGMANVMRSQWGADCETFYPLPGREKTTDVLLIGRIAAPGDGRGELIAAFENSGLDFGWFNPSCGMSSAEQNVLVNSARIVLAPMRGVDGEPQIKARMFENAAAGAFVLAEWHPEAPRYYAPGGEMVFWRSPGEAVDLAREYLARDEKRGETGAAAHRRTVRDHRMESRLEAVLRAAGVPEPV